MYLIIVCVYDTYVQFDRTQIYLTYTIDNTLQIMLQVMKLYKYH